MRHFLARLAACIAIGGALLAAQQEWKASNSLPGVDLSGLSPVKTRALLRMLRSHDCTCTCGMKVAECRIADPSCSWSKGIAETMADALRAGKNENEAIEAAKASRWAKGPKQPKLLEDAVTIPTAGSPVKGAEGSAVTLVEFSDFQCPYCFAAAAKLNAVLKAYPGKVKLIFKQFPLETHSQAALASYAAIAALRQGKFWEMHDALFAHRRDLSRPAILGLAKDLGLDTKRFQADLDSAETKKTVAADVQDGERAGVEGTPSVYVDGQKYNGNLDLAAIQKVIDPKLRCPRTPTPIRRSRRAAPARRQTAGCACRLSRTPCRSEANPCS
jgi:protein-disulfide isomerase